MVSIVLQWVLYLTFLFHLNLNASLEDIKPAPEITKMKKVYIYPGEWGKSFDYNKDDDYNNLFKLREHAAKSGFAIAPLLSLDHIPDFDFLIVFEVPIHKLHHLKQYPKEKLILVLWEPPSVKPENYNLEHHQIFSKVYTWNDSLVDQKKYFKIYYPVLRPMIEEPLEFNSRKLATIIAFNKNSSHSNELYSQRRKVIEFYETNHPSEFDLYGGGWTGFKSNKGPIAKKVDALKNYKFSYCYENIHGIPGYVTEKIFDCFYAGCVPIYWGASNIESYIPKSCFIKREDYKSDEELYEFIKNMSQEKYQEYMGNIRAFLKSDQAQLYSTENFIRIMMGSFSSKP